MKRTVSIALLLAVAACSGDSNDTTGAGRAAVGSGSGAGDRSATGGSTGSNDGSAVDANAADARTVEGGGAKRASARG